MPASSAISASRRLSAQVPDQRSGTLVTARPDEQFAPNSPIFNALPPASRLRCGNDEFAIGTIIPQAWRKAGRVPLPDGSVLGDDKLKIMGPASTDQGERSDDDDPACHRARRGESHSRRGDVR